MHFKLVGLLVPIFVASRGLATLNEDGFTAAGALVNKVCPVNRRLAEFVVVSRLSCMTKAARWRDCAGVGYHGNSKMCYVCESYLESDGAFLALTGAMFYRRLSAIPAGYTNVAGYLLKVVSIPVRPYADAVSACTEFGSLVRIDTEDKQNQILALLNDPINGYTASGYWIQMEQDQVDSVWKFDDGTAAPMDNTFWSPGQPNVDAFEAYCVQLWRGFSYMWDNAGCGAYRGYICERV